MDNNSISYEAVSKLYSYLKMDDNYKGTNTDEGNINTVTNRDFGVKDYTISSNTTKYEKQEITYDL